MAIRKIELENGFVCEVDEEIKDDMELLEALAAADENALKMGAVVSMVLGEGQKKALYEHLRGKNGRVKATEVTAAVAAIFDALGDDAKN